MNISEELIEKAKAAKTAEELISMAKAENIELTSEQANDYFSKLNQKSGEISDEELDNVAGGACYVEDGRLVVTVHNRCMLYKCYRCGVEYRQEHKDPCSRNASSDCGSCAYCRYDNRKLLLLCFNSDNSFWQ